MRILEDLPAKVAIGVLARAALALESNGNPAARPVLDGELELRERLIANLKESLGLLPGDHSAAALARLGDKLDEAADHLDQPDIEAAVRRLSDRGELPSDRYEISVIPNVQHVYRDDYGIESPRIWETVRAPDFEQHFGPAQPGSDEPFLVSLFARYYRGQFPRRNFWLMVVGRRRGVGLEVHQVWRLYPAVVKFTPSNDLIAMLSAFADAYGSEFKLSSTGQVAKMIVSTALPPGTKEIGVALVSRPGEKPHESMTSFFNEPDKVTGGLRGSLIVSINVDKYRDLLENMHWREPTIPRTNPPKVLSPDVDTRERRE